MKKLSKMIVAALVFVTVFAFVGCGTPAWQQVDTINTNANYETSTYDSMKNVLGATGENQITNQNPKCKTSFLTTYGSTTVKLTGVVDNKIEEGPFAAIYFEANGSMREILNSIAGADVPESVDTQMKLTMEIYGSRVIAEGKRDVVFYVDMSVEADGQKDTIKFKLDSEKLPESSFTQIFAGVINIYDDEFEEKTILGNFVFETKLLENLDFKVATEDDGTTKYLVTLLQDKTIDIEGIVYDKYESYIAINNGNIIKASVVTEGIIEEVRSTTKVTLQVYDGEIPTQQGTYKSVQEALAEME